MSLRRWQRAMAGPDPEPLAAAEAREELGAVLVAHYSSRRMRAHREAARRYRLLMTMERADALVAVVELRLSDALFSNLIAQQLSRLADIEDELAEMLLADMEAARP